MRGAASCAQDPYLWWSADSPGSNSETGLPSKCRPSCLLLLLHPYIHPRRDLRPPCYLPLRLPDSLRLTRTPATTRSCHCFHSCPQAGARPPPSPAGSASLCGHTTGRGGRGSKVHSKKREEMKRWWSRWVSFPENAAEEEEEMEEVGASRLHSAVLFAEVIFSCQLVVFSSHVQKRNAPVLPLPLYRLGSHPATASFLSALSPGKRMSTLSFPHINSQFVLPLSPRLTSVGVRLRGFVSLDHVCLPASDRATVSLTVPHL